jgi:hypothetical protein
MNETDNAMDVQTIAQVVRGYLAGQHPSGLTLEVVEDGIRKIDYWWQVQIRPDVWPTKTFELYDTLAEVESRIQEDTHLSILFSLIEPKVEQAA